MANKNTNPGGSKDDNEMRIQFGLILALCQNCAISHNPLFHAQNSNLFKGLSPMFPQSFPSCLNFHEKIDLHSLSRYFCSAIDAASARVATPSFAKITVRCFLTLTGDIPNWTAIS